MNFPLIIAIFAVIAVPVLIFIIGALIVDKLKQIIDLLKEKPNEVRPNTTV